MAGVHSPCIGSAAAGIVFDIGIAVDTEAQFVFHLPTITAAWERLLPDDGLTWIRQEIRRIKLQGLFCGKRLRVQSVRTLLREQVDVVAGVRSLYRRRRAPSGPQRNPRRPPRAARP